MVPLRHFRLQAFLAIWLVACGASAPPARVSSPFTAEDAEIFDDGIDFVAAPAGLEGAWHEDWREDLERRVGMADLIAIITVDTIRTDVDLERRETVRLLASVDDELVGEAPGDELQLITREGQPGFGTVQGNDRRILNQPFVAYVKWYTDSAGEVRPHWHLAPATAQVVEETRSLVETLRTAPENRVRRKVIIHDP